MHKTFNELFMFEIVSRRVVVPGGDLVNPLGMPATRFPRTMTPVKPSSRTRDCHLPVKILKEMQPHYFV